MTQKPNTKKQDLSYVESLGIAEQKTSLNERGKGKRKVEEGVGGTRDRWGRMQRGISSKN
jgi:hypothetical protein